MCLPTPYPTLCAARVYRAALRILRHTAHRARTRLPFSRYYRHGPSGYPHAPLHAHTRTAARPPHAARFTPCLNIGGRCLTYRFVVDPPRLPTPAPPRSANHLHTRDLRWHDAHPFCLPAYPTLVSPLRANTSRLCRTVLAVVVPIPRFKMVTDYLPHNIVATVQLTPPYLLTPHDIPCHTMAFPGPAS